MMPRSRLGLASLVLGMARWKLASMTRRDWAGIVFVCVLLAGFWASMSLRPTSDCPGRMSAIARDSERSDGELRTVDSSDHVALCGVYRRRLAFLSSARPVIASCGSGRQRTDIAGIDAETGFYAALVGQRCSATPAPAARSTVN